METTENMQSKEISTVGDIIASRKCLLFYPEQFIKIVLKAIQNARTGCAAVINDDGDLIGIVTEREILRRIFALVADPTIHRTNIGKYIDDMTVYDVMIAAPRVLEENTDIEQALEKMANLGFRYMPVISNQNERKALGIVDEREVSIHVKSRLDRIKREAAEKEGLLYSLFRETYGASSSAVF